MSATDELLPCPFCGGKAHAFHNYLWHVKCDGTNGSYYCVMAFGAFATEAEAIAAWNRRASLVTGETSDGYHTFDELYHHRAVLFSVIVRDHRELAWKSRLHHDGMFVVGIDTPDGQATYHCDLDPYWGMFDCKELNRAPVWDGHTPDEAIARIATLGRGTCRFERVKAGPRFDVWRCSACGGEHSESVSERADEDFAWCPWCGRRVV